MFRAGFQAGLNPGAIAGATPPGYDIFVLWFQSNTIGRYGPIDGVLDATDSRIKQYGFDAQVVALAADPLDHVDETADTVGFGMSFAKAYLPYLATNREILLVPCAKGGTGFSNSYWVSGGTGDTDALARVSAAMSQGSGVNRLVGILGTGGETDYLLSRATFSGHLDDLMTRWRSVMAGASSTTPFVFGGLLPGGLYTSDTNVGALKDTPSRVFYTGYAPSTGLVSGGDNVHTSAAGMRTMGPRFLTALFEAIANSSATVPGAIDTLDGATGDGQISLTWNAPAYNHAAITDYIVEYKLSSSGTWLTFSESTSATTGATVSGLTNGSAYDFRVFAVNSVGTGPASNVVSKTPMVAGIPTDYIVRLDADDLTTLFQLINGTTAVAANNDVVGQWRNKAANARHLVAPGDNTTRPLYKTDGTYHWVEADGVNDILSWAGDMGLYNGGACSVFVAVRGNPATNTALVGEGGSSNANYCAERSGSSVASTQTVLVRRDTGVDVVALNTLATGAFDNTDNVVGHTDSGTSIIPYVDGVAGTTRAYTRTGTFTPNYFTLFGLRRSAFEQYFAGRVYSLLIYPRVVDSTERATIVTYLADKMGRTL